MQLRSIKAFETRWAKLRKLAAAQLKDFERDKNDLAKAARKHKLAKDFAAAREAVANQKRVAAVIKRTKELVKTKDKVVKQAKRRGKLLRRAFS